MFFLPSQEQDSSLESSLPFCLPKCISVTSFPPSDTIPIPLAKWRAHLIFYMVKKECRSVEDNPKWSHPRPLIGLGERAAVHSVTSVLVAMSTSLAYSPLIKSILYYERKKQTIDISLLTYLLFLRKCIFLNIKVNLFSI